MRFSSLCFFIVLAVPVLAAHVQRGPPSRTEQLVATIILGLLLIVTILVVSFWSIACCCGAGVSTRGAVTWAAVVVVAVSIGCLSFC